MVRVLIALRRAILRNQLARTNPAMLLVGAGLVLISALGTIWLGLVSYPNPAAATDVLALVFALWVGGRVAQSALAGDAVLRPELFSLLPLDRGRLARSLLVVGLLDPAGVFMAIAFAALIARGARLGAGPAAVAVVAVIASLALAGVVSTIAGAVLGPGSRRGHDVGTIVTAVALSVVAVAATLLPALDTALRRGSVPWLADALTWLPTGWGPVAVQAAARGDWLAAAGSLAGLAVLTVAAADWWPRVLTRRMDAAARPDPADLPADRAHRRRRGLRHPQADGRQLPAAALRGHPHRDHRGRLRVQPLRLRRHQPVADRDDPGLKPGRRPRPAGRVADRGRALHGRGHDRVHRAER